MEQQVIHKGDLTFPPRKVWLKTFGCQMNSHDSQRILSHLKELNFSTTEELDQADLVLFNTCAIRDLSNQKFYSQLGEVKKEKTKRKVKIGVGGCIAQTEGRELIQKYPHLDFAFGTDVIDSINDFVYRTYAGESKFAVNTWDRTTNYSIETKRASNSPQAFINIIKGCDKFCSYCIVPFTRGREKSRLVHEVVDDIKRMVEFEGVQEVMLLGQNVNSYGKENNESLAQLLLRLEDIDGLQLVRYTTSHPYDVSDELIAVHGEAKKLSRHLHLPVQSGSNSVLQRMKREYTVEHYLGLLEKLRSANPEIVLSTDIIAGFPNETQEEHEATLKLLDQAQYDFIYAYNFSPRAGTKAARMRDDLDKEVRGQRLREIQAYQKGIQEKIRSRLLGQTLRVLVEGTKTMKGQTRWRGRSNCFRVVHFDGIKGQDYQWHWVDLKITQTSAYSCQGELVRDWGRILKDQEKEVISEIGTPFIEPKSYQL